VRPPARRRADAGGGIGSAVLGGFSETVTLPTLEVVAERAGVTVQTVLRRFGSKQGLHEAAASRARARIAAERDAAPVGDVEGAIENLLDHYERWGDVALRMLAAEAQVPASEPGSASEGRAFHRGWVERVFSPWLDELTGAAREQRVDQLVAVTDVYVWKLLARDLERSRRRIKATLVDLVTRTLG